MLAQFITLCSAYNLGEAQRGPAGAFKQKGTVSLWKNAFATLSTYFLMCRTGFLVILQYSQN
jgi:hypothetical protein